MAVKDSKKIGDPLRELDEAAGALERARAALRDASSPTHGERSELTVRALAERTGGSEAALVAFAETVGEVMGERELDPDTARRAALVAVAGQVWEGELGPLLDSSEVRELLGGVSRQRVDELQRGRRLIGLRDSSGRRRFPAFQFLDGHPVAVIVEAFWKVAEGALSEWTAAAWCVAADAALDGFSPAQWARQGRDPARVLRIAEQDRGRLAQ